jgi:uncharacterized membrane protein YhhN
VLETLAPVLAPFAAIAVVMGLVQALPPGEQGAWLPLAAFAGLFVVALVALETGKRRVFWLAKPAVTASLIWVVGRPLAGDMAPMQAVPVGLLCAAAGDLALVSERPIALPIGIAWFLIAHFQYTVAFVTAAGPDFSVPVAIAAAVPFAVATILLVRKIWPGVSAKLRAPVVLYGAVITVMVVSAQVLLAGPWPALVSLTAAAGALLFYVSDAMLALGQFHRRLPHGQAVGLAFYWTGQLGIALAARWAKDL